MKKLDLSALILLLFILGMTSFQSLFAQKAKIQWIQNSAAVNADTVDIYLNGMRVADNLRFQYATPLDTISNGVYTVNINEASSADSGDLVLARLTLTITGGNNTIMVCGVDAPGSYALNPGGRATDIRLVQRKGVLLSTSSTATATLSIFNGVSDNEGFNVSSRPSGISASKLKFGDTTTNIIPASTATVIDIRDTTGNNILQSYGLPLNLFAKKSLTVFASGFMMPASNQNGASFGLYYIDTLGGAAVKMNEIARVQFINNAADIILDTVDIWLNNTKLVSKLAFRKATSTTTINSGTYDITITKKNSPDTTGTNVVYRISGYNFASGKTHLGMMSGLVDPSGYVVNPDAVDRSFKLNMYDTYTETNASSGSVLTYFVNGVTDLQASGFNRNPTSPIAVFADAAYNSNPATASIPSTSIQIMQEKSAGNIQRAYRLNLTGQGGKVGVLFLSGFKDSTGNKTGKKMYGAWLALTDGTIIGMASLNSGLQLIHTSADPSINMVKLFLNGKAIADSFRFCSATPFMTLFAYKPYRIQLAPFGAVDTSTAFYSMNILPDSGKYYYGVATGLINPATFAANPDNVDRSFTILLNNSAKLASTFNSKNVELMYFNGITDAPATTARGFGQTLYLSKGDKYKSFHGYNPHSAFDDVQFDVKNAYTDELIYTCFGEFSAHKGMSGLVYGSGFINPAANNNGKKPYFFVAWPDGVTDSLPPNYTAIKESNQTLAGFEVYPIPAADFLTIKPGQVKGEVSLMIYDLNGRVISTSNLMADGFNTPISLPIHQIENGLYFIQAKNGEAASIQKILINR